MGPTLESYLRAAIPVLALLVGGIFAGRIRVLRPAFRLLNWAALWVILPIVIFVSIARYDLGTIYGFWGAIVLAIIGLGFSFVLAVLTATLRNLDRKMSVAIALNAAFMNVSYLGLPIVYALIGAKYLGPASLYAVAIGIPHLIFGITFAKFLAKRRIKIRSIVGNVITFPATLAVVLAMLFVGLKAPLPGFVQSTFDDYLAKPFFALMLLVVGFQIPIVDPRKYASALATVGAIRLLVCPLMTFFCIGLLGLRITDPRVFTPKPALIQSIMPPAVFNMILAYNFKLDVKLYGAIVLYLTFVSIFLALPLMMYFAGF